MTASETYTLKLYVAPQNPILENHMAIMETAIYGGLQFAFPTRTALVSARGLELTEKAIWYYEHAGSQARGGQGSVLEARQTHFGHLGQPHAHIPH